jgi:multiple sugar transport system substrate-binding protein
MRIIRKKTQLVVLLIIAITLMLSSSSCSSTQGEEEPVQIRLEVSLTPPELATFQPAIQALDDAHPEWDIILETTPQASFVEKINTQLAANDLPDIVRIQGLFSHTWIRQGAFYDLSDYIKESDFDLTDFFNGPLEQFQWQGKMWGIPDTAAPDLLFYNIDMFDTAIASYPTDEWTFEDMQNAAVLLTLDENGRNPKEDGFDPNSIKQWGWNGGISNYWQRHLVRPFGGDFCSNEDCTLMNFTSPPTLDAVEWWVSLVNQFYAAPYDPYSGSQTGTPGDPFISGNAAMGYNGFFAVGQLNEAGHLNYDIVQPLVGLDGSRYTPISTNGYVISNNSENKEAAWALVQALLESEFLAKTWGSPGHSVPARRSAAGSIINPDRPPENQAAIVSAMEYGEVYKPYTSSAFEVYGKTSDLFMKTMKGEISVQAGMQEIESIANETLERDR